MSLSQINVNNNQVTNIDNIPSDGSENLVKSGGVYKKILEYAQAYIRTGGLINIVSDSTGITIKVVNQTIIEIAGNQRYVIPGNTSWKYTSGQGFFWGGQSSYILFTSNQNKIILQCTTWLPSDDYYYLGKIMTGQTGTIFQAFDLDRGCWLINGNTIFSNVELSGFSTTIDYNISLASIGHNGGIPRLYVDEGVLKYECASATNICGAGFYQSVLANTVNCQYVLQNREEELLVVLDLGSNYIASIMTYAEFRTRTHRLTTNNHYVLLCVIVVDPQNRIAEHSISFKGRIYLNDDIAYRTNSSGVFCLEQFSTWFNVDSMTALGFNGARPEVYLDDNDILHFKLSGASNFHSAKFGYMNIGPFDLQWSILGFPRQALIGICFSDSLGVFIKQIFQGNTYSSIANESASVLMCLIGVYKQSDSDPKHTLYSFLGHGRWIVNGRLIDNWMLSRTDIDDAVGNPKVSIAKTIAVPRGETLELFRNSFVNDIQNIVDIAMPIKNPDTYATMKYGRFRENAYVLETNEQSNTFTGTLTSINQNRSVLMLKEITFLIFDKKSSPSCQMQCLIIGDSWTDANVWTVEFKRRLVGSGGIPVADGLSNINFIGTRHTDTCPNEGISGWYYLKFITQGSPFWYNGLIDFAAYCADHNFVGIDYVIIYMGCNAVGESMTIVNTLLDALLDFNNKMKILVGSNVSKYLQWGWDNGNALPVGMKASLRATNWTQYNELLEQNILDNYSSNIFYTEVPALIDVDNNYKYELVPANKRNSSVMVKQGIDNVHPANSAYLQVADAFYNAFHYWCL